MRKTILTGITLLMVLLAFGLTSCDDGGSKGSGALLTRLSIGSFVADGIPTPITKAQWADEDEGLPFDAQYTKFVLLNTSADLTGAISASASGGAKVSYGTAYGGSKPEAFGSRTSVELAANIYLYVEVISEDGHTTNYYRFSVQTKNSSTLLNQVKFSVVGHENPEDAGVGAVLADPGTSYADAGEGSVGLDKDIAANAVVMAEPVSSASTVKYAKVTGSGAPAFTDANTFTIADGDFIYVEVTAQNGNVSVYKIKVEIGVNASLVSIVIAEQEPSLGNPGSTEAAATPVRIMIGTTQPVGGFTVEITPADSYAKVSIAMAAGDAVNPSYGTSKSGAKVTWTQQFTDGQTLFIKVVSDNNANTLIYKVEINFRQSVSIKKSVVDFPANALDPVWANTPKLGDVKKVGGEFPDYNIENTNGEFKALYDSMGLYVYVKVYDNDMTSNPPTGAHEEDSVEVFVNEKWDESWGNDRVTTGSYSNAGGQYRVSIRGILSGDSIPAFTADGTTAIKNAAGGYYEIVMRTPWRFLTLDQLETPNMQIGLEIQINACRDSGAGTTRQGVVVWNNVAHTNYQNLASFGVGILEGGPLPANARSPVIGTQPASVHIASGATGTLSATVGNAPALNGTVTYQWYKGTPGSGTLISGATGLSYTSEALSEVGRYPYYLDISHNDNTVSGVKTVHTISNVAYVIVDRNTGSKPETWSEKIEVIGNVVPMYVFNIPAGESLGTTYTKVVVKVKTDAGASTTQTTNAQRLRVWGAFPASYWTTSTMVNIQNAAPAGALIGQPSPDIVLTGATDWTEHTIELNQTGRITFGNPATTANWPTDAFPEISGFRALAIGFPGAGGFGPTQGAETDINMVYNIKDITLQNANGSKILKAYHPDDDVVFNEGFDKNIAGTGNGHTDPTRIVRTVVTP